MLRSEGLVNTLRRILGRYQLARRQKKFSYAAWIESYDTLTDLDRKLISRCVEHLPTKPLISIIMPVFNTPQVWLEGAIDSVRRQLYPHWQLCIADDASTEPHVRETLEKYLALDSRIQCTFRDRNGHISAASNSALQLAEGQFIALVDHDDELADHALFMIASAINEQPDVDIIYSDENKIDTAGRRYAPQFKPKWNPDLVCSANYIAHLGVYRTCLARAIGGFRVGFEGSQDFDFALRCIDQTSSDRIRHIPHILYHWRAIEGSVAHDTTSKHYAYDAAVRSIKSHLEHLGYDADVACTSVVGQYRIRYPLPNVAPTVAIIIPLTDDVAALDRCIESVMHRSDEIDFSVHCVGTSRQCSNVRQSQSYLANPSIQLLTCRDNANKAHLLNTAVKQVEAEVVCVLNPHTEILTPEWLRELTSNAMRPEVGMVGAKVNSPHGTTLHSGFVFSGNLFGNHVGRGSAGAYFATDVLRDFTAVSGACMAMRRAILIEAGGFDEDQFGEHYYTLDLCLRLRHHDLRVLWTPHAQVRLHRVESIEHSPSTESPQMMQSEFKSLRQKWNDAFCNDPQLNPNLQLFPEGFELAFPPRVAKPWLARERLRDQRLETNS